jgi:hypothetical protein
MPFLAGRGQASRGYFGGGTVPDAPTLGTLTTAISSPNTVSTPTLSSQDCNNANFSWSNPGAGGVTIGIPFTAPAFNGGLTITNYEYSTDNGSTWKSSGSTTSPISITTVSGSSSNLSAATTYNIRLRAVNPLGSGTASSSSSRETLAAVTSYTIRVYNNRGTETLTETITGNTTGTYQRSHFKIQADWSVTVAAVNSNGTGSYSAESGAATGWVYSAYDADYATTRPCESGSGCDSCGTKTGTEDGTVARTCNQWTRSGCTSETGLACTFDTNNNEAQSTTWNGNCRDLEASCSDSWQTWGPEEIFGGCVLATGTDGANSGYYSLGIFGWFWHGSDSGCSATATCNFGNGIVGADNITKCSTTGLYRANTYACQPVFVPV